VLEAQFPPTHSVYSSREETVASLTAVVRKRRAWFTAVVRERPLGLQQPIDSQLSMLVIVLHLISTGSNLYSWEVHCFYLKVINKALYGQNHCLLPIENSQNQPQQAKARIAQKSSNLTDKFRRLLDIFRYNQRECSPCKSLNYTCFCTANP
jgi:hypothetical protein